VRAVLTLSVILAYVSLTANAAEDKDAPKDGKYTSKDGKFAIQFPKGAKVKEQSEKTADGKSITVIVEDDDKNAYVVIAVDLPAAVKNIPAKTFLEDIGKKSKKEGKLESSEDITLGKEKWPGREIVEEKNGTLIKTRAFIVDTRLYVLSVGGKKDFAKTKEATKFLDSFEITK
jgi:hypothetical protein